MLFTNPKIIHTADDVTIGAVQVSGSEIDYNTYKAKVYKRILSMVVKHVSEIMSQGNDKETAIKETADAVYNMLYLVDKRYPLNEEEIVDEILRTAEYRKWETNVYYNFMNIHKGVITETTPIDAGGTKEELKDAYSLAEEQDLNELLIALSAAYNL